MSQCTALSYPHFLSFLPDTNLEVGRFSVRFARTEEELSEIQRLRYEVFNIELGEGLSHNATLKLDQDDYDLNSHHLIVVNWDTNQIAGTYRLRISEMVSADCGFYSDQEFDLSTMPSDVRDSAVEIGRLCISKEYRNGRILFLLWRGLAAYLAWNKKTALFGCSSMSSQNPADGLACRRYFESNGHVHSKIFVNPRPSYDISSFKAETAELFDPPNLITEYLRYGAKICSQPAFDKAFKTIDFFTLFSVADMDPVKRAMFE